MQNRPTDVHIGNWREHPHNQWAFQNVREIIPTTPIKIGTKISPPLNQEYKISQEYKNLGEMQVEYAGGLCTLQQLLIHGHTDGLLVLKNGKQIYQWSASHFDPTNPHILFSVSKSVTAMLAGILESLGLFSSDAQIIDYLPRVKGSVYENVKIRHLLDMTVALDFEEDYSNPEGEYMQYRVATAWNPTNQLKPGLGLEEFLYTLSQSNQEHGQSFLYRSPNSDLLGLLLERVAETPLATLLSEYLWQPMGAQNEAYITVDKCGLARAAGGMCITIEDFARLGQLFIDGGYGNGKQILPEHWIQDTLTEGDQLAWQRGNYAHRLPNGKYRNKFYQFGDHNQSISGRGIHGQQLYINPKQSTVIVRFSSSPEPLNDQITDPCFSAFHRIAEELNS